VMSLTLDKAMTKRVIRDAGIPTPDFAVVHTPDAARPDFAPPYFVKPVAEGTGKGIDARSIVRRREDLPAACAGLMARFRQPVLVERFLPGREFTVGIVGTGDAAEVLGIIEVHLLATAEAQIYSYGNKKEYETRVAYRLVKPAADPAVAEAEAISLAAWRTLGCRDAGRIDIRCDESGRAQFLEVNPLAGLHPVHSDLPIICRHGGVAYDALIARIVDSAAGRRERPLRGGQGSEFKIQDSRFKGCAGPKGAGFQVSALPPASIVTGSAMQVTAALETSGEASAVSPR
jgi:D-alanine-D-alanine ligase